MCITTDLVPVLTTLTSLWNAVGKSFHLSSISRRQRLAYRHKDGSMFGLGQDILPFLD